MQSRSEEAWGRDAPVTNSAVANAAVTNVAGLFDAGRRSHPGRAALILPAQHKYSHSGCTLTYEELAAEAGFWQVFWRRQGLTPGDRVFLALPADAHLYAILLSLLGCGLVAIMAEPWMNLSTVRHTLSRLRPAAVVGGAQALRWHWLLPEFRNCRRFCLQGNVAGTVRMPLAAALAARRHSPAVFDVAAVGDEAPCLISFSSGVNGLPKAVSRNHSILHQQYLAMRSAWPHRDGEVDRPGFPLTVLHNLCCGMTSVMPAPESGHAGVLTHADAGRLTQQLEQHQVSRLSAVPAFFTVLCAYLQQQQKRIAAVRSLVVTGATVSRPLALALRDCFPVARIVVAYGSAEAEPVCAVPVDGYLREYDGAGYLAGAPLAGTELMICRFLPPADASATDMIYSECQQAETGEILVSGAHILRGYAADPVADRENTIPRDCRKAPVWHRTGDTGYLDQHGRLWLTGRVRDQIYLDERIIQPLVMEKQLDQIAGIVRSALVQSGGKTPRLYLQSDEQLLRLLPQIVLVLEQTGLHRVQLYRILLMPMDARHHSKIDRVVLRTRNRRLQVLERRYWKSGHSF
ncbi:MAG: hypothetical protein CMI03_08810 [Oceanospirillaceae bacterium]|uniref:AMP-binding protein n=1 Tax=unclassified Thalassolituus TaxID=2624967 RepID=UPI000C4297BE|nr:MULTISPECIES: AMP-binding protein [unclassified Thalassolituus]MAS24406.1 hypothetical protein [Oceanospirillaceae bacterium]MBL34764.1 hypothetical protein [Oceanospirillaceae bacterium]MBS52838.1 hypothetical protein [Oceanospirillaceae bacterium]|tara:strand:+ start:119 stop:1843 length:1725 start_codon:yes stop_codon:yes gene_type:complete